MKAPFANLTVHDLVRPSDLVCVSISTPIFPCPLWMLSFIRSKKFSSVRLVSKLGDDGELICFPVDNLFSSFPNLGQNIFWIFFSLFDIHWIGELLSLSELEVRESGWEV